MNDQLRMGRHTRGRRSRNEHGAAAVEFALVSVVLFMILFGIFAFGRVFNQLEVLNAAAREGARVAATRGTSGDVESAVTTAASPYQITGGVSVSATCADDTKGDPVTVSFPYTATIDIPLLPSLTKSMTITGTFRCE